MPTYQYACTACGQELEAVQSFSDASLTTCPTCQGRLRKVYGAVGVVFKGSGFYKTDSRKKESVGSSTGEGSTSAATSGDGAAKSGSTTESSAKGSSSAESSSKGGSDKGGSSRGSQDRGSSNKGGSDRGSSNNSGSGSDRPSRQGGSSGPSKSERTPPAGKSAPAPSSA